MDKFETRSMPWRLQYTHPFFISPAYSVPRMTISFSWKLRDTEVFEVILVVYLFAGNAPAL